MHQNTEKHPCRGRSYGRPRHITLVLTLVTDVNTTRAINVRAYDYGHRGQGPHGAACESADEFDAQVGCGAFSRNTN
jgi:hypothetical protein